VKGRKPRIKSIDKADARAEIWKAETRILHRIFRHGPTHSAKRSRRQVVLKASYVCMEIECKTWSFMWGKNIWTDWKCFRTETGVENSDLKNIK
jgi:hypothetical protein